MLSDVNCIKIGFQDNIKMLWVQQEKSENFNSLRPTIFELYKKNYRGGGQIGLPPQQEWGQLVLCWYTKQAFRLNIFDENIKQKISKAQILETDMIFIFLEYNLLTISLKYGMTLFKGVHRGGHGGSDPQTCKGGTAPPPQNLELSHFSNLKLKS